MTRCSPWEQMGVAADITAFAGNHVAGGFPLAGVFGRAERDGRYRAGRAGRHLCRKPLCAAALAVLGHFRAGKSLLQRRIRLAKRFARWPDGDKRKRTVRLATMRGLGAI